MCSYWAIPYNIVCNMVWYNLEKAICITTQYIVKCMGRELHEICFGLLLSAGGGFFLIIGKKRNFQHYYLPVYHCSRSAKVDGKKKVLRTRSRRHQLHCCE